MKVFFYFILFKYSFKDLETGLLFMDHRGEKGSYEVKNQKNKEVLRFNLGQRLVKTKSK